MKSSVSISNIRKSFGKSPLIPVFSLSLIVALLFSAVGFSPALAGPCDGTSGDDVIVCSDDSGTAKLKAGDDDFTQNVGGDIDDDVSGDGLSGIGFEEGGDDIITINGDVGDNVLGDDIATFAGGKGGDDVITIGATGTVDDDVRGDDVSGFGLAVGGDDTIVVDGLVEGDVYGDYLGAIVAVGGDDAITVNGTVEGDVVGDGILSAGGVGGDDVITVNGTVNGDVIADGTASLIDVGGDDTVIVGEDASIDGTIDGGDGTDTLILKKIYQDVLDTLDPASDSIEGYTWVNFEFLIGKLREIAAAAIESGKRILFDGGTLLAVDNGEGDGFKVFGEPGTIAFVPYTTLNTLTEGQSQTFQAPNSQGWYVVVVNLGVDPDNSAHSLYQVNIYNAGGGLQGQFTVSE